MFYLGCFVLHRSFSSNLLVPALKTVLCSKDERCVMDAMRFCDLLIILLCEGRHALPRSSTSSSVSSRSETCESLLISKYTTLFHFSRLSDMFWFFSNTSCFWTVSSALNWFYSPAGHRCSYRRCRIRTGIWISFVVFTKLPFTSLHSLVESMDWFILITFLLGFLSLMSYISSLFLTLFQSF